VIKQFITRFGKDAVKAEHKWDRLDEKEKDTWAKFKKYWKDEIKQWKIMQNAEKQAHEAIIAPQVEALAAQLNGLRDDISVLQVENQSYREENSALMAREIEFRQALQAEQNYRQHTGQMDGRQYHQQQQQQQPFTDHMSGYERRIMGSIHGSDRGNGGSSNRSLGGTSTTSELTAESYRDHNGGKGLMFKKYCVKCGCNTMHWSRQCPHLSKEERRKYKAAGFNNTMGGSNKFMERKGKHQADFNFDSL